MPTLCTTVQRIHVIDDDEMVRILLQETFWIYSKRENQVTSSRSIEEAKIKMAQEGYPDVLFIGLSLLTPAKSSENSCDAQPSLAFISELKKAHPDMHIIVYSKYHQQELEEKALACGANHFMVKGEQTPSEIVDFVETI